MNLLYINSSTLGQGDENLGNKLMVSFLKSLIKNNTRIHAVFCVNSGAFLTCQNPETIALFKELNQKGAVISTCGTCLDFYGLRDQLQVGEAGSMDLAITLMQQADQVIRP